MEDNQTPESVAYAIPPEPDRSAKIYFWIGLFVALGALGLPLIGVTVNVWLGGAILAIAFFCIVRAFWIWEKSSKFHILLRLGTIAGAAALYFGLAGRQIINQYRVDHPKPETATKQNKPGSPPPEVETPLTTKKKKNLTSIPISSAVTTQISRVEQFSKSATLAQIYDLSQDLLEFANKRKTFEDALAYIDPSVPEGEGKQKSLPARQRDAYYKETWRQFRYGGYAQRCWQILDGPAGSFMDSNLSTVQSYCRGQFPGNVEGIKNLSRALIGLADKMRAATE